MRLKKTSSFLFFVMLSVCCSSNALFWPIIYMKDHTVTEARISMHDGGHLRFLKMLFNLSAPEDPQLKQKLFARIQTHKASFELHPEYGRDGIEHNSFCWYSLYQKGKPTGHSFYVVYVPKPGSVPLEDFGSTVDGSCRLNLQNLLHYIFVGYWDTDSSTPGKIQLMGCPEYLFFFQHSRALALQGLEEIMRTLTELYGRETMGTIQLINTILHNVLKLSRDEEDRSLFYLTLGRLSVGFHMQEKVRQSGTLSFRDIPRSGTLPTERTPLVAKPPEQLTIEAPTPQRRSLLGLRKYECLLL